MSVRASTALPRTCSGPCSPVCRESSPPGSGCRPWGLPSECILKRAQVPQLRQTEVEDLYAAVFGEPEVLWFEVAMDDALLVGGRQPLRDLHAELHGLGGWQRTAAQPLPQALPFEELLTM